MNQEPEKKIGLIIGDEWEWPEAFINTIHQRPEPVNAELVKLSGTFAEESCPYDVILDRISHIVPYYRAWLKFAALRGAFIINNPFTWSAGSRFYDKALLNQLGYKTPRTIILPNKHIERDATPNTFRNLNYPMDWQAIIEYVGVPAIFKDNHTGGRAGTYRVHNVDELLNWYDQSGTRTKILQQLIPAERHIHCYVVGQTEVMPLEFSPEDGRYQPSILTDNLSQQLAAAARRITRAYEYDVNMVEFVLHDGETYVINGSNPAPEFNKELMTEAQFEWCLREIAHTAVRRALDPPPQRIIPADKNC